MIKTVLQVPGAAIALLLVFASNRPDTFRVERSTTIAAAVGTRFALIRELLAFNTWSPCALDDPAIQIDFGRGPTAGPVAQRDFSDNQHVGRGRISPFGEQAPSEVTMQLDRFEPFEGRNTVVFTLVPQGIGTRLTWAMHGPSAFFTRP
jgi:hypothetical protein